MNELIIGKIYRHFKGNYYYVENIAIDSETQERFVIYKPLYKDDNMLWTRKESMFLEEIDANRKDNITGQKHRFELVDNLCNNYIK